SDCTAASADPGRAMTIDQSGRTQQGAEQSSGDTRPHHYACQNNPHGGQILPRKGDQQIYLIWFREMVPGAEPNKDTISLVLHEYSFSMRIRGQQMCQH